MKDLKKGIFSLLLAGSLLPNSINSENTLQKRIVLKYAGFSKSEVGRINSIMDSCHYYFDYPIFFKENKTLSYSGLYNGLTNSQYSIEFESLANYEKEAQKEKTEEFRLWSVPSVRDPIENLVLHEVGHLLFSRLSSEERKSLVNQFFK